MGKAYLVETKYNYPEKFLQACKDGNLKYIKSLIERGKVTIIETENHKDSCGNFSHATIKTEL